METVIVIFTWICTVYFLWFALYTRKEAKEFIENPYGYNSEQWGDGYMMFTGNFISWMVGVPLLPVSIFVTYQTYFV